MGHSKIIALIQGLEQQSQQLEEYTNQTIRNAETIAEAHQLIRDVNSWLTSHGDINRIVRIAELRGLREVGKDFANKLVGMSKRLTLPELNEVRNSLAAFTQKLKDIEQTTVKRAEKLWNVKLESREALESILAEVQELERIFEGCNSDIEDMQIMRRALRKYMECYQQLNSDELSWKEYDSLTSQLTKEAIEFLGDDEPPWPPEETIDNFAQKIKKNREAKGDKWLAGIKAQASNIDEMNVAEGNALREKAINKPAYLTDKQNKDLSLIIKQIENHLSKLELDWLVERFNNLSDMAQKEFLKRIGKKKL